MPMPIRSSERNRSRASAFESDIAQHYKEAGPSRNGLARLATTLGTNRFDRSDLLQSRIWSSSVVNFALALFFLAVFTRLSTLLPSAKQVATHRCPHNQYPERNEDRYFV